MAEKASGRAGAQWGSLGGFVSAVARHAGSSGLWTAGLVAASALLDGAGLLLLAPLLGAIAGGEQGWIQQFAVRILAGAGINDPRSRLWVLLAIFLVLALLRAVVTNRRDVALAALQSGFAEAERNRLVRTLAAAPWPRLVALRHSETTALLSIEVQRLASACSYLIQGSVQVVLLAVQTIVALLLAPALAAAALAMLVVGTFVLAAGRQRIHGLGEGFVKANQAMMASAAALLGGLKSAVAQNSQHAFVAEFEATQAILCNHQLAFAGRQARGRMTYSVVSALLAVALVVIGVGLLAVPAAVLLTLILVFARMGPPAQQLYQNAQAMMFAVPAFEAVRRTEQSLVAPETSENGASFRPPEGPIELSSVTYLHAGGGGVRDVSLVLSPGSFVGIGGPSGAGKTTLADLFVGLLEPQAGSICVGGVALRGAARKGWAECVAYVTQEGFLFHDTVRRNLLWGAAANTSDADVAAALGLVGADKLVARLDQGLETVIGERGAMLSGGERQRIVLARAILRRPRLLVLDEAASAIDAASEAELLNRLKALDPRPTILTISHREESLARCDVIVRVESAKVTAIDHKIASISRQSM
jgi:ATP-binding cassette subfamily C protein